MELFKQSSYSLILNFNTVLSVITNTLLADFLTICSLNHTESVLNSTKNKHNIRYTQRGERINHKIYKRVVINHMFCNI